MLVLSRKRGESVVLGDEVTLTVEEISDQDGRCIHGARVRLGFESPRHITIYRSEWRRRNAESLGGAAHARRALPREGRLVRIPDARIRLKIELPAKIPVQCDQRSITHLDAVPSCDGATNGAKVSLNVTCQDEDRITICHSIVVATLDCQRFIPADKLVGGMRAVS
jgi:carbon storage regulator CsrA